MTYNFCTLFDRNYIFRGLAMYESMLKNCKDFELWILCMDDIVYQQLLGMNLKQVNLIKLSEFEDKELLAVKSNRNVAEYCWTLSSSLPLHIYKNNPQLELLAYIDADLYFFSSPEPIYQEMGDRSISIVRHNYSKELAYLEKRSGIYNVSMVIIRNDEEGLKCLRWWRERCLEWCFAYYEDGKLGDQMYLDDWPERFSGIHVVKNKGVNLAPWNFNKYLISKKGDKIFIDEDQLVYCHFHSFKMYGDNDFQFYYSSYLISKHDRNIIYPPYVVEINKLVNKFKDNFPNYIYGFDKKPNWRIVLKQKLKSFLSFWFFYRSLKK